MITFPNVNEYYTYIRVFNEILVLEICNWFPSLSIIVRVRIYRSVSVVLRMVVFVCVRPPCNWKRKSVDLLMEISLLCLLQLMCLVENIAPLKCKTGYIIHPLTFQTVANRLPRWFRRRFRPTCYLHGGSTYLHPMWHRCGTYMALK